MGRAGCDFRSHKFSKSNTCFRAGGGGVATENSARKACFIEVPSWVHSDSQSGGGIGEIIKVRV